MGIVIAFRKQAAVDFKGANGNLDPLLEAALKTDSLSLCLSWLQIEYPQVFDNEIINKLLAEIEKFKKV